MHKVCNLYNNNQNYSNLVLVTSKLWFYWFCSIYYLYADVNRWHMWFEILIYYKHPHSDCKVYKISLN